MRELTTPLNCTTSAEAGFNSLLLATKFGIHFLPFSVFWSMGAVDSKEERRDWLSDTLEQTNVERLCKTVRALLQGALAMEAWPFLVYALHHHRTLQSSLLLKATQPADSTTTLSVRSHSSGRELSTGRELSVALWAAAEVALKGGSLLSIRPCPKHLWFLFECTFDSLQTDARFKIGRASCRERV